MTNHKTEYNNISINIRLPHEQLNIIDELADQGRYLNRSDFIREAIRNQLNNMNILTVEDIRVKK